MLSKEELYQNILSRHLNCPDYPAIVSVEDFVKHLLVILYPIRGNIDFQGIEDVKNEIALCKSKLRKILVHTCAKDKGKTISIDFFEQLPRLFHMIEQDILAMYEGDPAAKSREEIIMSYPGFFAIASYRIAHFLYNQKVPVLPRMITEIAHQYTGIDIHPGAKIGLGFCIDHGTGIVIGETTTIGNHVKIYQGVTLGALSINKTDANIKRHPTIEDGVVVYAGATILGGETVIGKNSIIGGNVWLTKSVPPNSKVYYKAMMHHDEGGTSDMFIFSNNHKNR